jgi:hypothetical protein
MRITTVLLFVLSAHSATGNAEPSVPPTRPDTTAGEAPAYASPTAAPTPAPTLETLPYEPTGGWRRRDLSSVIGIDATFGGGVAGFTDRTMRDALVYGVGGSWAARLALGTHIPLGIEVGYVGTAAQLRTFAGDANGSLLGTVIEAALRWNLLPRWAWDPYVFAGMGWQRYTTVDALQPRADTGMASHVDLAEFPLGVGFSVRNLGGFTLDARGTFRTTTDSTLLLDPRSGKYANLDVWEASVALGYEF